MDRPTNRVNPVYSIYPYPQPISTSFRWYKKTPVIRQPFTECRALPTWLPCVSEICWPPTRHQTSLPHNTYRPDESIMLHQNNTTRTYRSGNAYYYFRHQLVRWSAVGSVMLGLKIKLTVNDKSAIAKWKSLIFIGISRSSKSKLATGLFILYSLGLIESTADEGELDTKPWVGRNSYSRGVLARTSEPIFLSFLHLLDNLAAWEHEKCGKQIQTKQIVNTIIKQHPAKFQVNVIVTFLDLCTIRLQLRDFYFVRLMDKHWTEMSFWGFCHHRLC